MNKEKPDATANDTNNFDSSSHSTFYDYYAEQSLSQNTIDRFRSVKNLILHQLGAERSKTKLHVADIGCGAGTQCQIWAESGHTVNGIDINKPLLELGSKRAQEKALDISFSVGSATELPWPDQSMDICLVPELLEHVEDWEGCLNEFSRIIKPGGILYISTSNRLCPHQEEFDLPFYSWYPQSIKRHYEQLALTTRPELVNFTKYPAVNWFSFYQLRDELSIRGLRAIDRFDSINPNEKSFPVRAILRTIRAIPLIRWFAHVATPYVSLLAFKE